MKKQYKDMLRLKEAAYKKNRLDSLLNSLSCPREFWGEIRKNRPKSYCTNSISEDEWLKHFEHVLNSNTEYTVPSGHEHESAVPESGNEQDDILLSLIHI
eukprot:TRINITY_DN126895_c0_g1_i1.p2 TRINITY_DN126895_c0_g1~~TRINITY_DN126895_c0_g1_i1.p2  ORF type:complete len:100 (+),score=15.87 TRINITY_DN126895_c0_g1_i1:88-387(+)